MADEGGVEGPGTHDIKSHPLVEVFVPDPGGEVVPLRTLFGLPDMRIPGLVRLWSPDFSSHADVPSDAIRYSQTLENGGTMLVVDLAAKVVFGVMQPAVYQQQFLTGSISAAHLPGAALGPITLGGERTIFPGPGSTFACYSLFSCWSWIFCRGV